MDSAMDAEPLPSPPPPSSVDQTQLGQGPQAIHTPVHRQLGQGPQAPRRRRGRGGTGMAPATEQAAAAAAWRRRLDSPQQQPVNGSVNGQQQLLLPQASPARGPAAPTGRTLTAKAWARCVATVCGSRACMSGTGVDHPSCMQVLTTTPLPLPHRYGRLSPPAGRMGKGGGPLPLDGAARRGAAHARVRWPRAHLRLARAAAAPRDALPRRAAAGMAHCQPRQNQREQSDGARDDARSQSGRSRSDRADLDRLASAQGLFRAVQCAAQRNPWTCLACKRSPRRPVPHRYNAPLRPLVHALDPASDPLWQSVLWVPATSAAIGNAAGAVGLDELKRAAEALRTELAKGAVDGKAILICHLQLDLKILHTAESHRDRRPGEGTASSPRGS